MEIIFQSHNAAVSPSTRERAEACVRRIGERFTRVSDALIRFEQDGPDHRVELVLRAPRNQRFAASGRASGFGPALASAITRLDAQTRGLRRHPRTTPLKLRPTA